jgi:malonyl-CoA/methylmalonyl-CoA synthetase
MASESLRECFLDSSFIHGGKTAITFLREGKEETTISYGQLNQDSSRMANIFINRGIGKGDRVVLCLPKFLGFVVAHLAIQKIGAIGVPLNPGFTRSEMQYLLEDTGAKLVVSGTEQEVVVKDIDPLLATVVIATERPYQELKFFCSAPDVMPQVAIGSEDPALIIYTSGTTGKPKGAILTQGNLVHDARNIIAIWEIRESDVVCHGLPLFHIHGLCFELHTALMAGSHVIMLDRFSPETALEVLSRKQGGPACTLFMAVPTMYNKLMESLGERKSDFDHIRLWASGSAPLLVKDFKKIKELFGKDPVEREGMSETGMNFSNPLRGIRKPGSIGLPLPELRVRIVNPETFLDVVPGQTGEIWLKGPGVSPGYWGKPEETARAFDKGWFKTGDLGRVDEDGYYYITDRIKHIIISGGENVSPKEVEKVINQFDGVVESSVVGIRDEKWGEKVVAVAVTRPGSRASAKKIQAFCRNHLHNWKVPKEIIFVEELPKNRMGKILKEEVKGFFKHRKIKEI